MGDFIDIQKLKFTCINRRMITANTKLKKTNLEDLPDTISRFAVKVLYPRHWALYSGPGKGMKHGTELKPKRRLANILKAILV